jgi:hypothetical protein
MGYVTASRSWPSRCCRARLCIVVGGFDAKYPLLSVDVCHWDSKVVLRITLGGWSYSCDGFVKGAVHVSW